MAGDTVITIIGNLVGDPELRFTPSGAAVANFTVASTPRSFDKNSNEWKDGETLFMRCSIWREAAENVAESLTKGARVIVSGRLKQRSYDKDGEKRTVVEMEADEVGPSLKYASAKVTKTERSNGQQGGGQQGGWGGQQAQPQQGGGWGGQGQPDPWATGGQQSGPPAQQGGYGQQQPAQPRQQGNQGGGWGAQPPYDEPPF